MRQLHNAMIVSLITASLLASLAILVPTVAAAAPADRFAATASRAPALPANRGPWRPPVDGLDLLTGFDPPPLPWMPGHRGVDLAATGAQAVLAAGAGTVVYAADLAGRGVVSIAHPSGLRTTYEPVEPLVSAGDAVTAGQTIGHLQPGHASCPDAACLHLGLKRGPLYLDPLLLFGAGKVRLLPRPGHTAMAAEHQQAEKSETSTTAMPRAPEISAGRRAQRIGTRP